MNPYDCIVIGGGPAGRTAALYLARFRRSVMLIDADRSRSRLIPRIGNYPGLAAGMSGAELLAAQDEQLSRYNLDRKLSEVESVEPDEAGFVVSTGRERYSARHVLFATGIQDIEPACSDHDRLVLDGLLRYCPVCDAYETRDMKICVLGPFADAAPKARFMRAHSRDVTLAATDDPSLWPADQLHDLEVIGVTVVQSDASQPLHRQGKSMFVPRSRAACDRYDAVYVAMGAIAHSNLGGTIGVACDEAGLFQVDDRNRTNIPGVYAAGDVVSDLHQISVAIGHAAIAASAINKELPLAAVD